MCEYAPLYSSFTFLVMKSKILLSVIAALTALPLVASAITIQPARFYTDVRTNSFEAAGINLLTREGIVNGYALNRFGPTRLINRAEFLKIAMTAAGVARTSSQEQCFPDVREGQWFTPYVCTAFRQNIVLGFGDGKFHPEYTVTYGEALKMLTLLFGYDVTSGASGHWAEKYYQAAAGLKVDLPITIDLDRPLTRGMATRLAAAFFAQSKGQLTELRMAESGLYSSSTSSAHSTSSSVSSSSSSVGWSSSSSSLRSLPRDPIANTVVRSQFLLLGETSPVIGAAKFFLEEEPLNVSSISVDLTTDVPTVQSLLVYDDQQRYLGRATLNSTSSPTNRHYRLDIPVGTFTVGKREERTVYFRAQLSSKDAGGLGGQTVQISLVSIEGDGAWSNRGYMKQSSLSDSFQAFITSRSTITSIANALSPNAALVTGTNRLIGSYTFAGRTTDASAKIHMSKLVFEIEQTGNVQLTNVKIGTAGIPDRTNCLVNQNTVTCSSIPESIGSLAEQPRTIVMYGDITAEDASHASLRLTLNQPGSSSTAGAVTWTDGTSVYTWVALDAPLALGTYYKY